MATSQPAKKPYRTPVLIRYGRVDQITRLVVRVSKP